MIISRSSLKNLIKEAMEESGALDHDLMNENTGNYDNENKRPPRDILTGDNWYKWDLEDLAIEDDFSTEEQAASKFVDAYTTSEDVEDSGEELIFLADEKYEYAFYSVDFTSNGNFVVGISRSPRNSSFTRDNIYWIDKRRHRAAYNAILGQGKRFAKNYYKKAEKYWAEKQEQEEEADRIERARIAREAAEERLQRDLERQLRQAGKAYSDLWNAIEINATIDKLRANNLTGTGIANEENIAKAMLDFMETVEAWENQRNLVDLKERVNEEGETERWLSQKAYRNTRAAIKAWINMSKEHGVDHSNNPDGDNIQDWDDLDEWKFQGWDSPLQALSVAWDPSDTNDLWDQLEDELDSDGSDGGTEGKQFIQILNRDDNRYNSYYRRYRSLD